MGDGEETDQKQKSRAGTEKEREGETVEEDEREVVEDSEKEKELDMNDKERDYFYPTNLSPLWTGCYDLAEKEYLAGKVMKVSMLNF